MLIGVSIKKGIVMNQHKLMSIVALLFLTLLSIPSYAENKKGCLVKMIDNTNLPRGVLLESRSEKLKHGEVKYIITNGFTNQNPRTKEIIIPKNKKEPIIVSFGVPKLSIREIRKDFLREERFGFSGASLLKNGYAKERSGQLTWIVESKLSSCSANDLSLIVFMVFEWFYFG